MIDIWQEIYSTIKRNKLRTFLTGFAVAWGIFMLIVLLGAGNGLIHAFEQSASERAMNSIKIFPGWTSKSYDGLKAVSYTHLSKKKELTTKLNSEIRNKKEEVPATGFPLFYFKPALFHTFVITSV